MRPLVLDDILPLEEFASRRREFFDAHMRYVNRHRRVRIGPNVTLLFENRQTLWFRVQEVLRVARLTDPVRVCEELAIYNRLLPGRDRLQAAFLIELKDEKALTDELTAWRALRGDEVLFKLGLRTVAANLLTCRPEDRCIGAAHWVQFHLDAAARAQLADADQHAYFELRNPSYQYESQPLSEDVRQSLLDDLQLSDQDNDERYPDAMIR